MFDRLLKDEFSTKRLTTITGTSKKDYDEYLTAQIGMVQPAGDLEELSAGNKVGQIFILFCKRIDLQVSDKVVVGLTDYVVKSVKDFNYGSTPHLEALIVKL
ncbi:MAG TPA: hypothetical protein DDY21_00235 [Candidatus Moranbacteria bacterium]|nr:hypothetical protein [Candidatus Moranbacteria bacterium]